MYRYWPLLFVWASAVAALRNIRCMNFYGLETTREALVCDWQHPPEFYLKTLIKEVAINTVRIPFSYQLLHEQHLAKLDDFVATCGRLGLAVILDYHRTWNTHQGAIPEENITLAEFINTWINLLRRYKRQPQVMGVGIFNEIQSGDFAYTNSLHKKVITAIEAIFPGRFYYFAGCPQWGGNCSDMDLEDMPTWNRTIYEVHKYIFSGASNPADWDQSIPHRVDPDHWLVGETGWKQDDPKQVKWAEGFIDYLRDRKIDNVCAWTIAHSGDTDGWFQDDCETFNYPKAALLKKVWESSPKHLRGLEEDKQVSVTVGGGRGRGEGEGRREERCEDKLDRRDRKCQQELEATLKDQRQQSKSELEAALKSQREQWKLELEAALKGQRDHWMQCIASH